MAQSTFLFRKSPLFLAFFFLVLLFLSFSLTLYLSSWAVLPQPDPQNPTLIIGGDALGPGHVLRRGGEVLLPFAIVKEYLDPHIFWDSDEGLAIVTTGEQVIRMGTDDLTAFVNDVPLELQVPVTIKDEKPYVPLGFLASFYRLTVTVAEGTGAVVVDKWDNPLPKALTVVSTPVRDKPIWFAPQVTELTPGETVYVVESSSGWYRVRTNQGQFGYLPRGKVGEPLVPESPDPPVVRKPWRPEQGLVNLTWEHVHRQNPDVTTLKPLSGVNVVSPTWFRLTAGDGTLANLANPAYVEWAQAHGYQVWGLVSNSFDPDLTSQLLNSSGHREHFIRQLLSYAALYELDGINLDFENMYLTDRELYVQLVRELAPLAAQQGLSLSVDVTFISNSDNWSRVYDRRALAQLVDYVAVMAYDEHWGNSPKAGSVASLPWVERGLDAVLQEVPAEKLLLGIPFYTRLWTETTDEAGKVTVSSQALSMEGAEGYLQTWGVEPLFDPATGQNYAEFREGNTRYRIWLEDETSVRQRLELVHHYGLAGVASWRRGFEKPEIWPLLADHLGS